jgi:hypothetical protein
VARAPKVDHLHPEDKNITLYYFVAVLWFRMSFDADPDPACYLNADQNTGSQTNADQTFELPKVKILHENIL